MADACHRARVGLRCNIAGLAAALDEVLGNPVIATAAASAAHQISEMPPASDVVPLLEELAQRGADR
jgi:UDP:flavonoid glycosyltransferase YjiC (YdhE family)